ncbi:hypothetical protein RI367_002283 [Sorochytrium milnesiophthora]
MADQTPESAAYHLFSEPNCLGWTGTVVYDPLDNGKCETAGLMSNLTQWWTFFHNTVTPFQSILIRDGVFTTHDPEWPSNKNGCYNVPQTVQDYIRDTFPNPDYARINPDTAQFATLCPGKNLQPEDFNHTSFPKAKPSMQLFGDANCSGTQWTYEGRNETECDRDVLGTAMLQYSAARNTTQAFRSVKVGDTSSLLMETPNWDRIAFGQCYTLSDSQISSLAISSPGASSLQGVATGGWLCPTAFYMYHTDNITDNLAGTGIGSAPSPAHNAAQTLAPITHLTLLLCLAVMLFRHSL